MFQNTTSCKTSQSLTRWLFCVTIFLSLFSFSVSANAGTSITKPSYQEQVISSYTNRKQTIGYSCNTWLPIVIVGPLYASPIHLNQVELVKFLYNQNTVPFYKSKQLTLNFAPRNALDLPSFLKG